jgi:hypothetical protein
MKKHIELLGVLHILYGGLIFLVGVVCVVILSGIGWLSRDPTAMSVLGIVGFFVALVLTILSIPGIITGIGLLKMKSWARILGIIIGCLDLVNIPFGTALGIYTLWVLLNDESIKLLSGGITSAT